MLKRKTQRSAEDVRRVRVRQGLVDRGCCREVIIINRRHRGRAL